MRAQCSVDCITITGSWRRESLSLDRPWRSDPKHRSPNPSVRASSGNSIPCFSPMIYRTRAWNVVTLEGFLAAIAIGPVTLTPERWLPLVFGSDAEDPMPELPSVKVFTHVVNLIMRMYNSVIMIFEIAPEEFSPTFYTHEVKGKTYTIVDEWCSGFLQGITLARRRLAAAAR